MNKRALCNKIFVGGIILLLIALQNGINFTIPHFEIISAIMMWILAVVTLVSGVIYIKDSANIIDFSK